jgi:histidinol dehydrogenase
VTTPPQTQKDNPAVAAALKELGVTEVYRIGGAQAIAALTYGTHSIRQVDKITGPGNRFVAAAKKLVFGLVGIDSIAGPTEVVIIANESARPEFIAADLLAQAEHGVDAAVVLITTNLSLAEAVVREIGRQIRSLARADLIRTSIERYGLILITHTIDEAYELVNRIAPEHVQIMTDAADEDAKKVRHAGAIFIGAQTPAAVGDYFAGPNHVLPTGGSARFSSALSVKDFLKRTSFVRYSADALREAAESIAALATVERLDAHAQSALIRLNHRQS